MHWAFEPKSHTFRELHYHLKAIKMDTFRFESTTIIPAIAIGTNPTTIKLPETILTHEMTTINFSGIGVHSNEGNYKNEDFNES